MCYKKKYLQSQFKQNSAGTQINLTFIRETGKK